MRQETRTIHTQPPKPGVSAVISLADIVPWTDKEVVWRATASLLLPPTTFLVCSDRSVIRIMTGVVWPSKIELSGIPPTIQVFREPTEHPHILVCIEAPEEVADPFAGVIGVIDVKKHPHRGDNFATFILKKGRLTGRFTGNYDAADAAIEQILRLS